MLVFVKLVHTAVWALFVAAIAGIHLFAADGRFGWALALVAVVLVEVVILLVNRMRCPLTPVAARSTDDRRPNFDIDLPEWLARYNREVFGTHYAGGILYAFAAGWSARAG